MKNKFLEQAEKNMPQFFEESITPAYRPGPLSAGDEVVLDLGGYYVGCFSFRLNYVDTYIDAPVRLSLKFCETKRELSDDFSKYNGTISASWLQEEIINADNPEEYFLPRRYAARYIKIRVMLSPQKLTLSDFRFKAVSSADMGSLKSAVIRDRELRQIDSVAVNTLKNCMQRVFEDGPKRDRRLWIGDFRLEALADYCTFNQLPIVRRCMYLFAAAAPNESGFIPSFVYENPAYVSGDCFLMDYALLYVAAVCDYFIATGDKSTFLALYPVIKSQMDAADKAVDADGILSIPPDSEAFIDWCPGLEKVTALHGVYLYVLDLLTGVLETIGHKEQEVYKARLQRGRERAAEILYDKSQGRFVNQKDNNQYSVHSTVWMILGGAAEGDEAVRLLHDVLGSEESLKPFTPYMHHYEVEAMIKLNLLHEAEALIKRYWGGMAAAGADTFYEVYVPGKPDFSPYGDRMINSMCHAWSCTPSYFIRKYFI